MTVGRKLLIQTLSSRIKRIKPSLARSTLRCPRIDKVEGPNYLSWITQFLPIMHSTDLERIVDRTEQSPPKCLVDDSGKEVVNPEFVI
jgi:hypothetical protein